MYKIVAVLFLLCCLIPYTHAQQAGPWTLEVSGGTLLYSGDMSYQRYPELSTAYQLGIGKQLSPSFNLNASFLVGSLYGNDRQSDKNGQLLTQNPDFARALNFRSKIRDASFQLQYRTDNGLLLAENARVAPYFFTGLGLTSFRVFADLYHGINQDQRYHYWLDGSIRDRGEGDAGMAAFLSQDGNYETEVSNIGTEAEGSYPTTVVHIPMGIGLRFRLSSRIALRVSAEVRFTFTDYLDDLSGAYKTTYADEAVAYAASPAETSRTLRGDDDLALDRFYFPSAGLEISLGKNSRKAPSLFSRSRRDPDGLYGGRGTKIVSYPDGSTEVVEVEPFEPDNLTATTGEVDTASVSGLIFQRDTIYVYERDTVFANNRMPDTVYKYIVLPASPERAETQASESQKALQSLYEKLLTLNEEMVTLRKRNERINQIVQQGGPGVTTRVRPDEALRSVFSAPEKEVLYYGFGEYEVGSLQQQRLQAIVSLMQENPSMGLLISGHADQVGDAGINLRLSRLRAEATAQYILKQSDIDPNRLITRFYGEAVPPVFTGAPNDRAGAERRVELDIIKIK